jgi:SAM-dependent methyltransferase
MTLALWLIGLFLAIIWLGVVFIGPPYVPALRRDVNVLFDTLDIKKGDHVVDLGAGDGRVLKMAAERGARVSGVEINPILTLISWVQLRRYKGPVALGNLWNYRLPDDTTHVFAFSAEVFMNKLEKYCTSEREHTSGFWLMCYGFKFKGREPEKVVGAFNLYRF